MRRPDLRFDPRAALLAWYDRARRELPWRAQAGERSDPYRIWLSEIMLQQTTVAAAAPYFLKFLERWPDVKSLAAAPCDEVLAAWAGLGYYARARNLHACAQCIARERGGRFPEDACSLQALPGIGPYTAGAIAAIAFGKPVLALDGNGERVFARYFAIDTPFPEGKKAVRAAAVPLFEVQGRAGDFVQAVMDLGSGLCTPKSPKCGLCPLAPGCAAHATGQAETLPVKARKAQKPLRRGEAYLVRDTEGRILLERRPARGLLGGMIGLPTSEWIDSADLRMPEAPLWLRAPDFRRKEEGKISPFVLHVFTHFRLELRCVELTTKDPLPSVPKGFFWAQENHTPTAAMPSVFVKAAKALNVQ